MNLQPTLKNDLIILRPLREDDFETLYEVAKDPLIWEQHPVKNRYEKNVFEKFFQNAINSGGALVVIDSKNNNIIGSSRYNGYNKDKNEIEIGWSFLARSYWAALTTKN